MPRPICLRLLWQDERRAFSRARPKTGKRMAARIAMIAITTSSSIRVKPRLRDIHWPPFQAEVTVWTRVVRVKGGGSEGVGWRGCTISPPAASPPDPLTLALRGGTAHD